MTKFQQTREVVTYCKKYIKGNTLDYGAGTGKYKKLIIDKCDRYTAFDMKPWENVDVVGDVLNPPFQDDEFDTVISTQVLEHVTEPDIMIREINRILKKNGICILTAPFMNPYHESPKDYFRFSLDAIRYIFEKNNFQVLECQGYGGFFTIISELIRLSWFNPEHKKLNRFTNKFIFLMNKLSKFLDKFVKKESLYATVYVVARKK